MIEDLEHPIKAETLDSAPKGPTSEPDPQTPSLTFRAGRFLLHFLREFVTTVVPAVIIALLINVFVAQAMVIRGPSMQPNLHYNQRVMVEKVTYNFVHGPRRGDIVTFDVPGEDEPLIKRVVALPGETIKVRDGQVFINDQALEESWPVNPGGPSYPATLVPPLHVFVMGDNRGSSRDSRSFGPVAVDQIIGRAWLVYWPLEQIKLIE
ncbi:MAG TPA: signal peptidase I [Chloroflexi bacterium]|nr:signal peptidase I [Chloroflexota bacterium]